MRETILTSTFMRLRERLRSMAAGITGSSDRADDALNDAFCKLWSKYPALDNEEQAVRLSYTVVRNSALDLRRHSISHPTEEVEKYSETLWGNDEEEVESEKREIYDSLLAMASRVLKPEQYQVFIMHDVNNISYPEIAERLGMTQSNVRQLLSRARKTIRGEYRKTRNQ